MNENITLNTDGSITLTAKIMEFDVPNQNGRMYPRAVGESIVKQATEKIEQHGDVFGEAGIPMGDMVDLSRVSHTVKNMRIENGALFGDIKVVGTPMGNIVKELLKSGIQVDFRSRGTGKIAEDGTISEYEFISVDAVLTGA